MSATGNGQVFKVHATRGYTVMSNHHLRNPNLSLKAKGILSVMLSLPDNWDFSKAGLVKIVKEGRTVVENALTELKEAGYLVIEEKREKGRFYYAYSIYEKPHTENPYAENPCTENQQQLNTKELNTKESITNKEERKKEAKPGSYDEMIKEKVEDEEVKKALYEFIKMRKLMRKPLTNTALDLLIKRLDKIAPEPKFKVEVLNQSIVNNWLNVYPLKSGQQSDNGNKGGGKSASQKVDKDYLDYLDSLTFRGE